MTQYPAAFRHFNLLGAHLVAVTLWLQPLPSGTAAEKLPVTADFAWFTQDRDFRPVEPAPWVYEGIQKVFLGDLGNPKTLDYIDQLADLGVTVIHTGGPSPYFPLRRDGGAGFEAKEREQMKTAFARMRSHGMRIVIGVSPYAPPEYIREHSDWRLKGALDERPLDPSVDLAKPENAGLRSMSLITPYGDYLIECLGEIFQDYGVDGLSFDGNYHSALNFTPYDIALFEKGLSPEICG